MPRVLQAIERVAPRQTCPVLRPAGHRKGSRRPPDSPRRPVGDKAFSSRSTARPSPASLMESRRCSGRAGVAGADQPRIIGAARGGRRRGPAPSTRWRTCPWSCRASSCASCRSSASAGSAATPDRGRRPGDRVDEPRPEGRDVGRTFREDLLLPSQRRPDCHAAAGRAPHRHSELRRHFMGRPPPPLRPAATPDQRRSHGGDADHRLAGDVRQLRNAVEWMLIMARAGRKPGHDGGPAARADHGATAAWT